MSKLNNIINNSFDILISSVKIGVSYTLDKVNEIKSVYFVESNIDKDDKDYIWNGGETFGNVDEEMNGESTETPYDDIEIKMINYDGIMEEVEE
jgi:hypothetical protein